MPRSQLRPHPHCSAHRIPLVAQIRRTELITRKPYHFPILRSVPRHLCALRTGRRDGRAELLDPRLRRKASRPAADLRASPHGRERVVSWPLVASSDAGNFFSAPESIFSAGALASALATGGTA